MKFVSHKIVVCILNPTFIDISDIVGVKPVEQSIECTRAVDEKSGRIQVTLSWKANFTKYPSSYYGDTLDYTHLSLFKAKRDSDYDNLDFRTNLPTLALISTNQNVRGLGKGSFALKPSDREAFGLTFYDVRANGSGFISFVGLRPAVDNEYDHFLLLVSGRWNSWAYCMQ